jgi:hypothetical protein
MSSTSVVTRGADRIAWQVACGLLLALAVSVVAVLIYGYAYSGSDVQV